MSAQPRRSHLLLPRILPILLLLLATPEFVAGRSGATGQGDTFFKACGGIDDPSAQNIRLSQTSITTSVETITTSGVAGCTTYQISIHLSDVRLQPLALCSSFSSCFSSCFSSSFSSCFSA